jgi:hypothetical protein
LSRRPYVVFAVLALSLSSSALAGSAPGDRDCTRAATATRTVAPPQIEFDAVFARVLAEIGESADETTASMSSMEVVIARVGNDGKPVMACVDNNEAAQRFFRAPIAQTKTAQDQ